MSTFFSNILVAFDGSENSVKALEKAKMLTKLTDAHLTVVYADGNKTVSPIAKELSAQSETITEETLLYQSRTNMAAVPIPNDVIGPDIDVSHTPEDILSDAKSRLSNALKNVDYEILPGKPAEEICRAAEDYNVDLIIVGNRGLSGLKKLVMGSVSEQVTHQADCTVLVVK